MAAMNKQSPSVSAPRGCLASRAMRALSNGVRGASRFACLFSAAAALADDGAAAPEVTLTNGLLTVQVSPLGAELRSVRLRDCEYLWQGDPAYWSERAPVLFPICGSLFQGRYTFGGREYTMPGHGFARTMPFRVEPAPNGSRATFTLESDDATRAQYPFNFALSIEFRLDGQTLLVEATVRNTGTDTTLPFAYGGHPGLNVPIGGEGAFEDWFLEFAPGTCPDTFEFDDHGLITGHKRAYPLEPGNRLTLRRSLFDSTGLFLDRAGREVTLRSESSSRSVTVHFPDMPYLGLWHASGDDTPFLCIEPWCGLPSYHGTPDDFATRPDMVRLAPGASTTLRYSLEFR